MRKLACIKRIENISAIEGADKIEVAHIGGWRVVVQKEQFRAGELAVYFEIDSALPANDERYTFLKERCLKRWFNKDILLKEVIRIKTIKLRGVVSQGLLIPLNDFPEINDLSEGSDVTEILGILHMDDLQEEMGRITGTAKVAGKAKGNFPSFIPKTDEERIQNLAHYFSNPVMNDVEFEVTYKDDGSSMTVYYAPTYRENEPFGVCSRNIDLKDEADNIFWKVAHELNLRNKLAEYCIRYNRELALQGELVGPGINGNRDLHTDYHYRLFRIWDIAGQRFLTPSERYSIKEYLGIEHVYVLTSNWNVFADITSIEEMLSLVDRETENGNPLEGMVFKAEDGSRSFKCINNNYLLKEKN